MGTSQLWTEPGWISGVTPTSIWWAAPGASVVRASGAPPSPTARVRGTAACMQQMRTLVRGWEWGGKWGKIGCYTKWGACGGRGECLTLSSIHLPQTSCCSPPCALYLCWGLPSFAFLFFNIFPMLLILGSHIFSFPVNLSLHHPS